MEFTAATNLAKLREVVMHDDELAGCGGVLIEPKRRNAWAHDFREFRGKLHASPSSMPLRETPAGTLYQPCDLICNFGVFRTQVLRDFPWDERLELGEHRAFFWKLHKHWRSALTPACEVMHYSDRPTADYKTQRSRAKHFFKLAYESIGLKMESPTGSYELPTSGHMSIKARVLNEATIALNAIGCEHFLSDGCVLGWLRERDFIGHDPDIDVGVFSDQPITDIAPAMKARGFTLEKTYGAHDNGFQLVFRRNEMKLDVFIYYRGPDSVHHSVWNRGEQRRYVYTPFTLNPTTIQGVAINVPSDTERYVVEQYGEDWRAPDKAWHWWTSPKNLYEGCGRLDDIRSYYVT